MAYADQEMSTNRIVALVAVALIHIAIGYVLVTGLAFEAVSKVVERVTTVDIEEPPPPEPEPDEPPPPEPQPQPETAPPPPVAPPPPMNISPAPPQIRTQPTIPPPAPPALRIPPAAPVGPPPPPRPAPPPPPPPPPPPSVPPTQAQPRNAAEWITTSDYRPSWVSREYTGTVTVSLNVGANGRVAGCNVTGGSAPQELKDASCRLIERRARFNAATRNGDDVAGTYTTSIRWQLPD